VPGIITQLSYDISQESTWDIFAGLPHMIKVTMNFTPIHKFIPKLDTSYINYLDGGNTDEDGNILPAIGFVDSPFLSLSSQVYGTQQDNIGYDISLSDDLPIQKWNYGQPVTTETTATF